MTNTKQVSHALLTHFHFLSRMYRPAHGFSPQPEEDFTIPGLPDFWTKTNDSKNLGDFSAICILFAKNLAEKLGNKANSSPYLLVILLVKIRIIYWHKIRLYLIT
jgi:hypothetical protein